jgi:hypothetical protein
MRGSHLQGTITKLAGEVSGDSEDLSHLGQYLYQPNPIVEAPGQGLGLA